MDKKTLSKLLKYVAKYRFSAVGSLIFSVLSVVCALYLPILNGRAIDCIIEKGIVDLPRIVTILWEAAIVIAAGSFFQWIMTLINNRLVFSVVKDIRQDALDVIQRIPLSYADSHSTGDIVSRIITDAEQIGDGLLLGFSQTFTGVMTILGTLIFMLRLNITVTAIVVVITPLSLFVASFIAKNTHKYFTAQSETRGKQTTLINEVISEEKTVQAFNMGGHYIDVFNEINDDLEKTSLKATFYSSLTNPCTRFVNSCIYAAVAAIGALNVISGGMTVGSLTIFLSYAGQYTKPFNEISSVLTELQNAAVCAGRLFELCETVKYTPEEIFTAEEICMASDGYKTLTDNITIKDTKTPRAQSDPVTLSGTPGNVGFDNVSFSYTPDRPLIKNLNLDITNGMHVAIVGPTGCGKTTLINLLERFYDVNEGEINLNGQGITEMPYHGLRKHFGMVLQETWIKTGTVRDNICIGKPDATDEEVEKAAKAVHAHSFIKRLPQGYDTMLGEGGAVLSAGEAQLLCICRVMIAIPSILILDEATSSIDTRTEHRIQRAFSKMTAGRTSFIIAHRLSTIKNSDLILVMKDGNIIEQGDHNSLMSFGGFYSELYNSQFAVQ